MEMTTVSRYILGFVENWVILMVLFFQIMPGLAAVQPPATIKIGAVVGIDDRGRARRDALLVAADYYNQRDDLLPHTKIEMIFTNLDNQLDPFQSIRHVCELIEHGVSAVIGPASSTTVHSTQPICAGLQIPQIAPSATNPQLSEDQSKTPYLLKMSAPDNLQSEAMFAMFRHYGWTKLAVMVSKSDYGQNGVKNFISMALQLSWTITAYEVFEPNDDPDLLVEPLERIIASGAKIVLLNCLSEFAWLVLREASKIGMLEQGWAWAVTDSITASVLDPIYITISNSACNVASVIPYTLQGLVGTTPSQQTGKLYRLMMDFWNSHPEGNYPISGYTLKTMDALVVTVHALHAYFEDGHTLTPTDFTEGTCMSDSNPWVSGPKLMQYMQKVQIEGVMNFLNFTENGYPWFHKYDIVNLQTRNWIRVGVWHGDHSKDIVSIRRPVFPGQSIRIPYDSETSSSTGIPTLNIVTILDHPFVMPNPRYPKTSSEPFIGFCIDLLKKLQENLSFKYTIHLVADGYYGSMNAVTLQWNGMMQEIINSSADMAICTMYQDRDRVKYVDMTTPFLESSLAVLIPIKEGPVNLFLMFDPIEGRLWVAIVGTIWTMGILISIFSFLSPYGYRGRFIQRLDKTDNRHATTKGWLSSYIAIWFSIASFVAQGASLTPVSTSGRLITTAWWFTIVVITAVFTANLTVFLTVITDNSDIRSVEDLVNQKRITYGTMQASPLGEFFKNSDSELHKAMHSHMTGRGSWVTNSKEGIRRVKDSYHNASFPYAYISDMVSLRYFNQQPPCTTKVLEDESWSGRYSLALRKNSPYTEVFSAEISRLRGSGYVDQLKSLWINGNGLCPTSQTAANEGGEEDGTDSLGVLPMAGLLMMLAAGIGIAWLSLLVEFSLAAYVDTIRDRLGGRPKRSWMYHVRRRGRRAKTSVKEIITSCFMLSQEMTGRRSRSITRRINSENSTQSARSNTSVSTSSQVPDRSSRKRKHVAYSDQDRIVLY